MPSIQEVNLDGSRDDANPNHGPELPEELSYLITSFIPSVDAQHRSKAFLNLSAYCQGVRSALNDKATEALARVFTRIIHPHLQDTDETLLLAAISFLTALFQVDWESAALVFQQDEVPELIADTVDVNPSARLSLVVAQLLGQACGHKTCRGVIPSRAVEWLQSCLRQSSDVPLRAAAAIALVKLSKGNVSDKAKDPTGSSGSFEADENDLARLMKQMVVTGSTTSFIAADAVEGLAYLSTDPNVKETLAHDSDFLKHLFRLVLRRKDSETEQNMTVLYGVLLVICNLTAYLPQMTEEQAQIEKLKRMAKTSPGTSLDSSASPLNDDSHVKARVKSLVAAGVLDVFAASTSGVSSPGIRLSVGQALLNIVTDQTNRGKVLQAGGGRTLSTIIKHGLADVSDKAVMDVAYLGPVQALAKLAITASPVQVFGPDVGMMYNAIRPFSILLQHPSATLLQRFEALMALTNLASHSPETANKVASSDGVLSKTELLLLEDHRLIRRASMELICNLIGGSDVVYERYGGADNPGINNKLQLLLAMSDVEDLPTRLAASGALATVTSAPSACKGLLSLQLEKGRVLPILTQLIDPGIAEDGKSQERNTGLIHRGLVCVMNVFGHLEVNEVVRAATKEAGLLKAVTDIVKSQETPPELVEIGLETLKVISR